MASFMFKTESGSIYTVIDKKYPPNTQMLLRRASDGSKMDLEIERNSACFVGDVWNFKTTNNSLNGINGSKLHSTSKVIYVRQMSIDYFENVDEFKTSPFINHSQHLSNEPSK